MKLLFFFKEEECEVLTSGVGVFNIFGKQCLGVGVEGCVSGDGIAWGVGQLADQSYVAYNSNIIIKKRTTEATLGL